MLDGMSKRFLAVAEFFNRKKLDEEAEYGDFLSFYEGIVRATPISAVQRFGEMSVMGIEAGETKKYGLLLTPTDFAFWQSKITKYGVRFVDGPDEVKNEMMNRMAKFAEQLALSPEDRATLLDIIHGKKTA